MNNKDTGTIYFLAGLLLGGIVGAGIGMLVAPESGEKNLAKLKKTGAKVVKNSLRALDEFQEKEIQPRVKQVKTQLEKKFNDFQHGKTVK